MHIIRVKLKKENRSQLLRFNWIARGINKNELKIEKYIM